MVGLMGYDLTGKAGDWPPTFTVNLFVYEDEPAKRARLRYLVALPSNAAANATAMTRERIRIALVRRVL